MENNENLVIEEPIAENTEITAEEIPKTYTEDEFNAKVDERVNEVLGKKVARKEAKIRKEYQRKYGNLEEVLKAGTGKENVEEMTDAFREFYQQKGIDVPQKDEYSAKDIEVLAKVEAEDIIRSGFDEVVEEADRLKELGASNMTAREKAVFLALTEHIKNTEQRKQLAEIGVTEDVLNSQEFKDFASKFNSDIPISDIYNIYNKTKPRKEYQTIGSMKQSVDNGVKDYYSPEEIERLTEEDLDNPQVWEAVRRSMTGG